MESGTITQSFNLDCEEPETVYIFTLADRTNNVDESNENNNHSDDNLSPGYVTVHCGGIPEKDVEVTSVSVSDSNPCSGDTVTISYTVRNNGDVETGIFTNSARWSTDSDISLSDTELDHKNMSSISPRGPRSDSMTVTIPSDATIDQTYYVGIYADSGNVIVPETSDSNNGKGTSVTIQSCGQPKLEIVELSLSNDTVRPKDRLSINYSIRETSGTSDAQIWPRIFLLSPQPVEGALDEIVLAGNPIKILAGRTREGTLYWDIPKDVEAGTYSIILDIRDNGCPLAFISNSLNHPKASRRTV